MEPFPIRLLSQLPPTAMTGRQQWLHMAFSFLIVISGMRHTNFWPTRKVWLCWHTAVGQEELTFVHVEKAPHSGHSHPGHLWLGRLCQKPWIYLFWCPIHCLKKKNKSKLLTVAVPLYYIFIPIIVRYKVLKPNYCPGFENFLKDLISFCLI